MRKCLSSVIEKQIRTFSLEINIFVSEILLKIEHKWQSTQIDKNSKNISL